MAARVDAGHEETAIIADERPAARKTLCDIILAVVGEEHFDRGRASTHFLSIVVHDVFALLKAPGRFAVKAPQQRIQDRRLSNAVLSIDDRDILVFVRRKANLTFSEEASEIL